MTNEEAREIIKCMPNYIDKSLLGFCISGTDVLEALDLAIKALKKCDRFNGICGDCKYAMRRFDEYPCNDCIGMYNDHYERGEEERN